MRQNVGRGEAEENSIREGQVLAKSPKKEGHQCSGIPWNHAEDDFYFCVYFFSPGSLYFSSKFQHDSQMDNNTYENVFKKQLSEKCKLKLQRDTATYLLKYICIFFKKNLKLPNIMEMWHNWWEYKVVKITLEHYQFLITESYNYSVTQKLHSYTSVSK